MLKRTLSFYHFLSRHFLTPQRVNRLIRVYLLPLGLLAGFLAPSASTYANTQTLQQISTAQFSTVETTTSISTQYPLPNYTVGQYFSLTHPGIDLDAPYGTAIYPVADGEVKEVAWWIWGYGRHIIIDHGDGYQSLYAHLSIVEVKVGDKVNKTTVIGRLGTTGWTTGPHLHLEIHEKGRALNPLEVLPEREN